LEVIMAWFDFMNQANARGRDAGSIARQRLNARAGMPAPGLPAISTSLARVAGFNTAALSPLLDSAHWAKEQMRKARLIPDISSIQYRPVRYPELNRPDYSGAGERARRFEEYKTGRDIPGANTNYSSRLNNGSSTGSPAAERDYQQKVSRVAQLTAQDPELQRYEYAREKAKLAGPGSAAEQSAEDLGMQMWAKANPKLAAKVKPGQAGYDVIQNTLAGNAARAGAGFKLPDQLVPTPAGFPTAVPAFTQTAPGGYDRGFGITTNLAPGATLQALQPTPTAMPAASPTFNLGAAFGQPGVLDEETLKRFSDILLQSAK
jgi:hypothetical protein